MIQHDVKARRIGSTVSGLPVTGQPRDSQKRRDDPSPNRPLTTPSQSQVRAEDFDEYFDDSLDEAKDELYVSLSAKVVGLQYYKGKVLEVCDSGFCKILYRYGWTR